MGEESAPEYRTVDIGGRLWLQILMGLARGSAGVGGPASAQTWPL